MKILKIAAVVAVSAASLSALAKDPQKGGVTDNTFAFAPSVSSSQPVVISAAIEGSYSTLTNVAIGTWRLRWVDGLRSGPLRRVALCRSGVRTKPGINMVGREESCPARLPKEG
jgi:hypothetical protein